MNSSDARYADVEVVSEGGKKEKSPGTGDPVFALLARLMDDVFRIPGTKIKFGLDPLIGLIPGLGDSSGAIISAFLIIRGAKAGIPRIVLCRMALNVVINTLGGAIPFLGDLFSVWFKSNQLNYALFQKHSANTSVSLKTDWLFVVALLVALLAAVGLIVTISIMILAAALKYLAH